MCVYIYTHYLQLPAETSAGSKYCFPLRVQQQGSFFWLSVKRRSASPDALQSTMAAGQMSFEGWRSTDS